MVRYDQKCQIYWEKQVGKALNRREQKVLDISSRKEYNGFSKPSTAGIIHIKN